MRAFSLLLSAALTLPAAVQSADKPAKKSDYSDVCHPGDPKGVVLCETSESYEYCKSLEGVGEMLIEGDDPAKPTKIVSCQQAG